MTKTFADIKLDLSHVEENLSLVINERNNNTLFEVEDALKHGKAKYQLKEGCFYDYELSIILE